MSRAHLQREAPLLLLPGERADASRCSLDLLADAFEVARRAAQPGTRTFWGRGKRDRVLTRLRSRHVGNLRAVADCDVALVDHGADFIRRLERRLIEAGKRPSRIGGFELRGCVVSLVCLPDVQASQLLVQFTPERDRDLPLARLECLTQRERQLLRPLVERRPGGLLPCLCDGGVDDCEVDGVEDDRCRGCAHLDVDAHPAGESFAFQVRSPLDDVAHRHDSLGQALGICSAALPSA